MNPDATEPKTLYYPASGADICYPFLLFPTLETVYSFALEEFGEVADINNYRDKNNKLPNNWYVAAETNGNLILQEPTGYDEAIIYSTTIHSLCANLLFRIRHILQGTTLEVKKSIASVTKLNLCTTAPKSDLYIYNIKMKIMMSLRLFY
ncbi:MAG: hypothetical protein ACD_21C00161G0004 [uncultured bacterium]|nr:MAG: hypothetical protein ACD_21C00161G0004 [uncultured bacterium]